MTASPAQEHWNRIYSTRPESELSWFQSAPSTSLDLLLVPSLKPDECVLDVGGGASVLVDTLLGREFTQLAVLDISARSLEIAKDRLGQRAGLVRWIEADITQWNPDRPYRGWHDRAVFHFLTTEPERAAYCRALQKAVHPGGIVVIGTFALERARTMQRAPGAALLCTNACG